MGDVVRGVRLLEESRERGKEICKASDTVGEEGFKFLILPEGEHGPFPSILARERGYNGVIYHYGHNLGVCRAPGCLYPDLRLLESKLPGWFIHWGGYLACWGSRKHRAETPPPGNSPKTPLDLWEVLQRTYK